MLRLVHIVDIHLDLQERFPYEVDTWGHWESALRRVRSLQPDAVVLGGDLALHVGDLDTYRVIADQVADLPCDVLIQPGNHDDGGLFGAAFGRRYQGNGPLDRIATVNGQRLVLLDTAAGRVTTDQLRWLESQLVAGPPTIPPSPVLVFMHHPPSVGFNKIMDQRFALENHERVLQVLQTVPGPVHVFCGHYHMEHVETRELVTVYVTPACYFQIDPESSSFRVDHKTGGMRVIEVDSAASTPVSTRVEYLE